MESHGDAWLPSVKVIRPRPIGYAPVSIDQSKHVLCHSHSSLCCLTGQKAKDDPVRVPIIDLPGEAG